MSDATVKGNAGKKQRKWMASFFMPFLFGALGGIFFFHFVPAMLTMAASDVPLPTAAARTLSMVLRDYESIIPPNSGGKMEILIWPAVGAVIVMFLRRLYDD